MKYLKYLKKLRKDEIIIGILFIIVSVLGVIFLHWWGLLLIPLMLGLIIIYLNIDKISSKFKKKEKIVLEEENDSIIHDDIINESKVDIMKKISKKRKTKKKNNKTKERKLWKRLLSFILICGIIGIISVAGFLAYIVISAGTFDPDALTYQDQTVIYDNKGEVITTLGREKRETITYDKLPQVLVDAIIATEDSRFNQHNGVDLARFLKASVGQLLGNSSAGGASTLTMQVVKNNLTSTESSGIKGIIRKFKDVYLSVFFVEKNYTKEEILEFYVNDSLLGGNVYGVEEASKYYFNKSVSELTLPEAALIAGLFQSPNGYNPYKNPEAAAKRMNTVLNLMVRHEYITKEEANLAKAIDVKSLLAGNGEESDYQGYIDTVIAEVIEKTGNNPSLVSMKIYTNMDRSIQDGINAVLNGTAYTGWENDVIQSGIAITDVNTGGITAIGAGRNREGELTFNYATMAKRQPGSTSKPLFDYGPGFEYNNFSTYTPFNDEPWTYTNGPEIGNWDGGYYGLITLRTALAFSRNVPALKAFQQVSKKNILNFVQGLGLDPTLEDGALHEAYSIGGGSGFTPLEMAVAYACFANGGYYIESHAVNKIEYRSTGEVEEFKYNKERVMSESTAYLMNNVLQYAVESGFNGGARVYGSTVAAKTGTSNIDSAQAEAKGIPTWAVVDLWTVAYTPEYAVSLWYGYEELSKEHYLTGASAPKDAVMAAVMRYVPKSTTKWTMPSTVVVSQVEAGTVPAKLPSKYTPSDMIMYEYFIKGTQPTEVSDRYAKLEDVANVKTSKSTDGITLTWDFTTPKIVDKEYLTTYFSQPTFGKETEKYLNERLSYNTNTLGDIGFGIYQKDDNDTLTFLEWTNDEEYTYYSAGINGTKNITLVIKVEYEKFKSNASDGITKTFSITGTESKLAMNIGSSSQTVTYGNYNHTNPTITYDNRNVSSIVTVTYTLNGTQYTSTNRLEEAINLLEASTTPYQLKYSVTYKGETITKIKRITISNPSTNN